MGKRPNILLLFSDQQRADTLPFYGNDFVDAPYLEGMAGQGTVFSECRTVFPVCTPARTSMWTGVYPHTHNVIRNAYGVDDLLSDAGLLEQSVFSLMKSGGYQCAYYGKWHLGTRNPGPFDVFNAFNSWGGHWVDSKQNMQGGTWVPDRDTDDMIDWIRTRDRETSFFSVMSWYPPHDPFSSPLDTMDHYRRMKVPFPGYYGSVTALDRCVGRVFAALEECGELENTIVIYYSDHGENFHLRDGTTSKFMCTEESVHVPFVISGPGIPSGETCDAFIGIQDLMPTVLDYAGVEAPDHLQGRSIRGLLEGTAQDWRDCYYIENETYDVLTTSDAELSPRLHERGLRTRTHKLILSEGGVNPRLFDLTTDPEERLNLMAGAGGSEHPDIFSDLVACLEAEATALSDHMGLQIVQANQTAPNVSRSETSVEAFA
ncbi:sulfatase [Pseudoruegeria sp. SK021]|uniref:sulfatase family protein n=1 Tax=Pseudoruegeria sp. SK021 TaxID=1933035 RepID=UPI000A2259E1|nr:sulfatase-like hydrolase/transferase [Pseudoruegeria sp. SK021]OSP54007.1 hypothetical protein BV911_14850 [Pseudoruegeria sp. SK021]